MVYWALAHTAWLKHDTVWLTVVQALLLIGMLYKHIKALPFFFFGNLLLWFLISFLPVCPSPQEGLKYGNILNHLVNPSVSV